jgi:hypothetical protein
MHLVQILLPLYDNEGDAFAHSFFAAVRQELVDRFGGLTTYSRAPAKGMWEGQGEGLQRDDLVVYEVMVKDLDRKWWGEYRAALALRFRQEDLVVRAVKIEML